MRLTEHKQSESQISGPIECETEKQFDQQVSSFTLVSKARRLHIVTKVKVKQSRYRPGGAQMVLGS